MKKSGILNRAYLSLFVINLIVSMSFYMLSTTIALYATGVGLSAAVAGTVVGVLSVASMCMRPFTGIISDRMERRRLLIGSLLLIAAAVTGCSLTSSVTALMLFRILHGIGFSMATTITMTLVAGTLPAEHMTQGMGYFAIGQTISSAIAPSIGLAVGERFGFAVTFRFAAGLLILSALMAALTVEPQPPAQARQRFRLSDCFAAEALPYCLMAIVVSGCTGLENSFISLYGQTLSLGSVGWYFTFGAAALFVARAFGGRLADRSPLAVPASLGCMVLAFVLLGCAGSFPGAGAMSAVFALAAVLKALGLGTAQPALQARSLNSVPASRRGAASCTYYLGTDVGQALAPVAGGLAVQAAGYGGMFLMAALPVTAVAVCTLLLEKNRRKEVAS